MKPRGIGPAGTVEPGRAFATARKKKNHSQKIAKDTKTECLLRLHLGSGGAILRGSSPLLGKCFKISKLQGQVRLCIDTRIHRNPDLGTSSI
jgi:hypothetical protein